MLKIHQEISAGTYPNNSKLATLLEVSTKSVARDVAFMRDRMELPIEYDSRKWGYYYSAPVSAFPTLQISEGELVALLVAEKALQQYRGTAFEKPLYSSLKKLAAHLPDTVSLNLGEWERTISFRTRAEPILNIDTLDFLARAAARRLQVEFDYRKPGQTRSERRVTDPYHLANINGEWFLFAYDHGRKDIRTFAPARMSSLRETGKTFPRPEKFSLEQRLHDSFGVVAGSESFEVVIHFNRYAADYIREKRWHQSQEIRELADGGIEVKMTLSSLDEVERWILSWGGHAQAIKPKRLVEQVRAAAQKIVDGSR
jgi:predicted DNA-binding transcriptional regulator YafY